MITAAHYNHVKLNEWPWVYFLPEEMASKRDGSIAVDPDMMDKLETARRIIGKPFHILSAYRDPIHNAAVGGAPMSMHKFGKAVDIATHNHDRDRLVEVLKEVGFTGFGIYKTFIHADTGRARTWEGY